MAEPQHTNPPLPPSLRHWRTVVDFDGMTWGDLRAMMRHASHLADDADVELDWAEYDNPPCPTGIIIRGRDA